VVSVARMFHRFRRALKHAIEEEDFGAVLGAGGVLVLTGTIVYTLDNGWKLVDGFYFAVMTLTTSSIADPHLVLKDDWIKVFTAFYILIGIGIFVEIAHRLGRSYVEVHNEDKEARAARKAGRPGSSTA
jgi:voltage-gated potassium channel